MRLQVSAQLGVDDRRDPVKHRTGAFAPAIVIDNTHWLNVNSWPTLGEMICSVSRVVFQDGTVWNAQP
jgi:hypothetical protein